MTLRYLNIEELPEMATAYHYGEMSTYDCEQCIVSVGRSGSKWMENSL